MPMWGSAGMPTLNGSDYSFDTFLIIGYKYFEGMGYSEQDAIKLAELVSKHHIYFYSVRNAAQSSNSLSEAMNKIQNNYERR